MEKSVSIRLGKTMKKKRFHERENQVLRYLLEKEVATSKDISNSLYITGFHASVTLLKLFGLGFVDRKSLRLGLPNKPAFLYWITKEGKEKLSGEL